MKYFRNLQLFVVLGCVSLLLSCGTGSSSSMTVGGTPTGSGVSSATVQHFAIIVLENVNYDDAASASNLPFLNSLMPQAAVFTSYYADVHPSIGNYFGLTTGTTPTLDDSFSGSVADRSVVSSLNAAGKTWKVYAESIPSAGYVGGDAPPYMRRHNPFSFLKDVKDASQTGNIVSLDQLQADISSGSLPNYIFIVPNTVHDGHDCPGNALICESSARLANANAFLASQVPSLLNSSAFKGNGVLAVTWDESETDLTNGGGHVLTMLLGRVKPGSYSQTVQHPALLRLSMEALGVGTLPGASASAPSMSSAIQ